MTQLEEFLSVGIPLITWSAGESVVDLTVKAFGVSKRQAREWQMQGAIQARHFSDFMILKKGRDIVCVVKTKSATIQA